MKFILTVYKMGEKVHAVDIDAEYPNLTSRLGRLLVDQEELNELINIFKLGISRYMEGEVTLKVIQGQHFVALKPTSYRWVCPVCFWTNDMEHYSETVKCEQCGQSFGTAREGKAEEVAQ